MNKKMVHYNYENKVAIVTGAARGIGKNIARGFAESGALVYVLDRDSDKGLGTENEFLEKGFKAKFVELDLTDLDAIRGACKEIYEKNKKIDVLVNNAKSRGRNSLLKEDRTSWDEGINVMLTAPFFLSQEIVKYMDKTHNGSIVNIGSILAQMIGGEVDSPVYHVAKAGVLQMTRYMAVQAAPFGVRVNAVLPGFIVQDEHKERYRREDNKDYRKVSEFVHPLIKEGDSDDIANTALFLSSDAASYINGQCIVVDGGASLREQHGLLHQFKNKIVS